MQPAAIVVKIDPISIIIGYTETREEGLNLLASYNNDPWDVDTVKISFAELLDLRKEKRASKLSKPNQGSLYAAAKRCTKLSAMPYRSIKSYHKETIDACGRGYATQPAIKNLWGHLDRFAMELDVISKCYSTLLTAAPVPETTRDRFSKEQIDAIWERQDVPWMDSILVLIYSGWRITEFLGLKTADVDLAAKTMVGGVKTQAGKNRIVPMHSLIYRRADEGNEYLFSLDGVKCTFYYYRNIWSELTSSLKIQKTPRECRHTFESLLDSAGANRKCIDLMMGHKSKDTGNRVYNHKTLDELRANIELITR